MSFVKNSTSTYDLEKDKEISYHISELQYHTNEIQKCMFELNHHVKKINYHSNEICECEASYGA